VTGFNDVLTSMAEADFFTGLLPFVLAYLLFFVALKQVPIFKEQGDDRFPALVSVVLAFFVARFVSTTPAYQQFFVDYLGFIAVAIVGLLGLLVVISFVGLDIWRDGEGGNIAGYILLLVVLAGFFVTGGADIFIPDNIETDFAQDVVEVLAFVVDSGLIWLLLVLAIFWWTLKPADGGDDDGRDWHIPETFYPRRRGGEE